MLFSLILLSSAFGQDTGVLTGTVTDATGAVVVAAQVTAINTATNFETATTTNTEGLYRIPFLRPGDYRVRITAAGFKSFVRENVDLRVGATLPINAVMELGAVAESVNVTSATPLLETETSTTGTIIDGDFFQRMPLYQRHSRAVLYLTPGVNVGGLAYAGSLGGFSINGGATSNIGFFEDGMYGVQPSGTNTTDTILSTIEEAKVITTVLPAEYGHSAGGAIVIVKKSGTNQLHGEGGLLFREGPMQHRRFMQPARFEQTGNSLHFYQPDYNVSGPVYIPKLYDGRNKTFFMFAGQYLMERQGEQISWSVPTADELAGNFSYGGRGGINAVYDPRTTAVNNGVWSRSPFPGNIIPRAQWDPVATKFLSGKVWELPNLPGTPTATGYTGNLQLPRQKTVDWENYSLRLDEQFTSKFKLFYNWSFNTRTSFTPTLEIVDLLYNTSQRTSTDAQTTTGFGATYTISPSTISETRINYYRFRNDTTWPGYGTDFGARLGIPNIGKGSMPVITGIPNVANPSLNVEETINFKEDVSRLSGKHAFKFGYDLMRLRRNSYTRDNNAGTFNLAGTNGLNANGTGIPNTGGNALSQLLTGAVSSYAITSNILSNLPRNWIHSLYVQDDWKIRSNLTLNLGVRWQVQSTENNKYGQVSSFDPTAADNNFPGGIGVITHPKVLHKQDWNNFQPRVGLAWTTRKNMVIRSGFAVSTVDERLPVAPSEEYGSITGRIDTPNGDFRPRFQLSQGPVASLLQFPTVRPDGSIPFAGTNFSGRSATWVDVNRKSPYTMNWNFGVQQSFATNYMVEMMYTGNSSVNGFENREINSLSYDWANNLRLTNPAQFSAFQSNTQIYRPYPNFGSILFRTNGARSNYHAGTVKLDKRFSHGLSLLTFYTYSKLIDSSSGNNLLSRNMDRAEAQNNRTHQYTGSMNYEIPFGKGRKWMNKGGWVNAVFGGFDMVWLYRIQSGDALTFTFAGSPYQYMPGVVAQRGGRPNSTGDRAGLRDNWQDIGGDRFVQANQNGLIQSMSYFDYPLAFQQGNVGRNTFDRQRFIDTQFSASKQWSIKERATAIFRFDFQNPFKWYNLSAPNVVVNFTNPATFGKVSTSTSDEGTTANAGGQGLMNITLTFRF
ncbi:MAG: carboxypeptidase regulatory-like domain-containing protein [Acidobacteria bacterium]|nr:carboxypeptidase regulatory-like domain-containing protein [Acidobacteriota bacterium]